MNPGACRAFVAAVVLGCAALVAQPPVSPEELEILRDGVRLHDAGDYDAAIARYREALEIDPRSGVTLHQIGYAQQAKGDLAGCLETASGALEDAVHARDQLFVLAASCADDLGRISEASALFERGLEEFPEFVGLTYNYAVLELRRDELSKAAGLLEKGLETQPRHASSHRALAMVYAWRDADLAAVAAALRFLSLEPQGGRAVEVLGVLESLVRRLEGAEEAAGPEATDDVAGEQEIGSLRLSAAPDGEAEEQKLIDLVQRGASAAAAFSPDGQIRFPSAERQGSLREIVRRLASAESGLGAAQALYRPFFEAVVDAEADEALSFFVLQMIGDDVVADWPAQNQDAVRRLLEVLNRP